MDSTPIHGASFSSRSSFQPKPAQATGNSYMSFAPILPAPRPSSQRLRTTEGLSPDVKCALLSKAKQRHEQMQTKISLLEQEHRTREEGKKPSCERAVYAAIEEMCSNTKLVGRSLAQKTNNLERLTMLTNRVEEYLTNSLQQSLPYNHAAPSLGIGEMATELRRLQADNAVLTRLLQSATDRLAEEAAETDAQSTLAANLRQSLMQATSELENVRADAERSQREAEELKEINQRLQAEVKFAAEERQMLTGNLRSMVDTLAEENGRLKATAGGEEYKRFSEVRHQPPVQDSISPVSFSPPNPATHSISPTPQTISAPASFAPLSSHFPQLSSSSSSLPDNVSFHTRAPTSFQTPLDAQYTPDMSSQSLHAREPSQHHAASLQSAFT